LGPAELVAEYQGLIEQTLAVYQGGPA
jgi:hypothetical protein